MSQLENCQEVATVSVGRNSCVRLYVGSGFRNGIETRREWTWNFFWIGFPYLGEITIICVCLYYALPKTKQSLNFSPKKLGKATLSKAPSWHRLGSCYCCGGSYCQLVSLSPSVVITVAGTVIIVSACHQELLLPWRALSSLCQRVIKSCYYRGGLCHHCVSVSSRVVITVAGVASLCQRVIKSCYYRGRHCCHLVTKHCYYCRGRRC